MPATRRDTRSSTQKEIDAATETTPPFQPKSQAKIFGKKSASAKRKKSTPKQHPSQSPAKTQDIIGPIRNQVQNREWQLDPGNKRSNEQLDRAIVEILSEKAEVPLTPTPLLHHAHSRPETPMTNNQGKTSQVKFQFEEEAASLRQRLTEVESRLRNYALSKPSPVQDPALTSHRRTIQENMQPLLPYSTSEARTNTPKDIVQDIESPGVSEGTFPPRSHTSSGLPTQHEIGHPSGWVSVDAMERIVAIIRMEGSVNSTSQLPPFSGNVLEWPKFSNKFHTSTREQHLSDEQNIIRLEKALQGPAREQVRGFLHDASFVSYVMEKLASVYGETKTAADAAATHAKELVPLD